MITFLPFPDLRKCAESLDNKRLGKQRVENLQIYTLVTDGGEGKNQPAIEMWRGYHDYLVLYAIEICGEWFRRGFMDSTVLKWYPRREALVRDSVEEPWWFGNEYLHRSHRSMLLQKLPEWYHGRLGWEEPILPYWWPTRRS